MLTHFKDFWDMPPCILVNLYHCYCEDHNLLIHTAMRSLNLTFSKGTKLCPYCFVFDFSLVEWAWFITDAGWMESYWTSWLSGITGIQEELIEILAGTPVIMTEVFNSLLSPSTHTQ